MTKFSAIVPIFNHATYLPGCIDSLLKQTRRFDEIILVDDASSESEVRSVLNAYSEKPNVRIITLEQNRGIVNAQNTALQECQSDYIAFIDCDDYIAQNALERVELEVGKSAADYYFTDRSHVDAGGLLIEQYKVGGRIKAHEFGLSDYLLDHMVASHLKVISKRALLQIGGFEVGTDGVQDWDVALKISEFGKMIHIPASLYFHRLHQDQNSNEDRPANFRKTNIVRRNALERRRIISRKSPTLLNHARTVILRLADRINKNLDTMSSSKFSPIDDAFLLVMSDGRSSLYAVSEISSIKQVAANSIVVVFGCASSEFGFLRQLPVGSDCVFGLMVFNDQESIAMAQWFNSYFDIVTPLSFEAELAMLGFCWSPSILTSYKIKLNVGSAKTEKVPLKKENAQKPAVVEVTENVRVKPRPALANNANDIMLSVVLVAYNMSRELPRTLKTLSETYQKDIKQSNYEVIVVDNGSDCSYDVDSLKVTCPNLAFYSFHDSSCSPARAFNYGISQAKGEVICGFIDAARMASPSLLSTGLSACRIDQRAAVGSISMHLGYEPQNVSVHKGYNQDFEDNLLRTVNWEQNGYQLFRIAAFDGSSQFGFYSCPAETNSLFMRRDLWSEYGGLDQAFECRGGGLVNLDLWSRLCDDERNKIILLLGEATFHQFHGGAATNATVDPWNEFHYEYVQIRGKPYTRPMIVPLLVGSMHELAREFESRRNGENYRAARM